VSDLQKSCEVAVVEVFEEGVDVELGVDLGHVEVEPGPQTFREAQVIFLQDLETTKRLSVGCHNHPWASTIKLYLDHYRNILCSKTYFETFYFVKNVKKLQSEK
jgi:hypothetical protein